MGTGRRDKPAGGRPAAQDARKAPRMAQDGLSGEGQGEGLGTAPEPVLGHPRASGEVSAAGGVEGHAIPRTERLWRGLRTEVAPKGLGRCTTPKASADTAKPVSSPAQQPSIFRPRPLAWERKPYTGIDDLDRHLRARARFAGLVRELSRRYRKEFPARKYEPSAEGCDREKLALLCQYGGLPPDTEYLNEVPAAILEEAVQAFADYFGLDDGAGGVPAGARVGPAAELDPPPSRRNALEAPPW